jgi:hypothetical protein
MKHEIARIATLALVLGLGAGFAPAQNTSSSVPPAQSSTTSESLGDLARKLKAERAKSKEKPKVFTNDDLATLPPLPGQSTASPAKPSKTPKEAKPGEKPAQETSGKGAESEAANVTPGHTREGTHGEEYFRDHMGQLQDRLQIHRRELGVLEQKLGQNQMMYYPDPNQGLLQQSGPTAMSNVYKLQDQITKKKAEITADQEAIEDLEEQLRREGGEAGWLRSLSTQSEISEGKIGTKESWQARFKLARAQLADARQRQQLAEDELNLLQIQNARALDPNVKADLTGKIKAKEGEVSRKRAVTEEAQKALDDLEKEFQASGAPDEWSEAQELSH